MRSGRTKVATRNALSRIENGVSMSFDFWIGGTRIDGAKELDRH